MKKLLVSYWSGTGNTEEMARLIKNGAESAGISVDMKNVSEVAPEEIDVYDVIALGCPSMGDEELEPDMDDFIVNNQKELSGRSVALFGSYGWGDGQWMQNWEKRMKDYGASLINDSLIVKDKPEGEDSVKCVLYGKELFSPRPS